jgi:hypothetical protein
MPAEYVYAPMEIDHIIPKFMGGSDSEHNLCLACPRCNRFKADQIRALDPISKSLSTLFNPQQQDWATHFQWGDDGALIVGLTAIGRATIAALQLNHPDSVLFRQKLVSIGWHPPQD